MTTDKKYTIICILLGIALFPIKTFGQDQEAKGHFQKGHRFYLDSKPAEAEAEFKNALELDPTIAQAHYYLGSIYFKEERYAEAVNQCKQALKINPQDLNSLIILGLCLQEMQLYDAAITTFQKACNVDNQSAPAHSALGLAYCAKGELATAEVEYNILKKIDAELADDLLQHIESINNTKDK